MATLHPVRERQAIGVFWLLADQAIYAGGNFLTNIAFARWLSEPAYGLYTLSFGGFLFLSVLHYGALLEPLLIQSAQVRECQRRSYVRGMALVHIGLFSAVSALSALGFVGARALHAPDVAWAILGAGIGGSAILVLLTARRLCLVFLSASTSAVIGSLYTFGSIGTVYLLRRTHAIFWGDLWLIMGGWSLLCSLLIFGLLFHHTTGAEPFSLRDVYRLLRRYAGWSVLSSVCLWLRFQSILFLLAWFVGVEAVAQTRAILNTGSPLDQALVALHASWLVRFSAAQREGGRLPIIGTTLAYCSAVGIAAALLWLVSAPLVSFLYGGRYTEYAWQVPWYYVALGFLGIEHILSSAFKVRGLLRTGYLPQIGSILLGAGAGLVLIQHLGQPGAIFAIAVLYASSASLLATLLSRSRNYAAA
jgi:O-antigen/teichoic acid export membrane protein